jgi:hypothetical protein
MRWRGLRVHFRSDASITGALKSTIRHDGSAPLDRKRTIDLRGRTSRTALIWAAQMATSTWCGFVTWKANVHVKNED